MNVQTRLMALFIPLIPSLIGFPAFASESADYARMGRETWAAFECTVLAGEAEMVHEQMSIFNYGYERGGEFFAADQSGKISGEDHSREVPLVVTLLSQGPNVDFMLGRIYEQARRTVLEDVLVRGDKDSKVAARERYERNDCGSFVRELHHHGGPSE